MLCCFLAGSPWCCPCEASLLPPLASRLSSLLVRLLLLLYIREDEGDARTGVTRGRRVGGWWAGLLLLLLLLLLLWWWWLCEHTFPPGYFYPNIGSRNNWKPE
jgi:hypothetical protein